MQVVWFCKVFKTRKVPPVTLVFKSHAEVLKQLNINYPLKVVKVELEVVE